MQPVLQAGEVSDPGVHVGSDYVRVTNISPSRVFDLPISQKVLQQHL